jgi:hypothetical protein
MDHSEDVERLFSWLKAPQVHYREFAPQREVADAVATWPVVHRTAVQTGVAAANEPAPEGDAAAKERIARDRMTLPTPPVQHVATGAAEEPAVLPEAQMSTGRADDRRHAEFGEYAPSESAAADQPVAGAAATPDEAGEPAIAGFEQPATSRSPRAAQRPQGYEPGAAEPARHYPAPERGALFHGEYRGREGAARPAAGVADRQPRSLDAVFSRLGGGRDRLPDPRARARTSPGLGPVFNRLR